MWGPAHTRRVVHGVHFARSYEDTENQAGTSFVFIDASGRKVGSCWKEERAVVDWARHKKQFLIISLQPKWTLNSTTRSVHPSSRWTRLFNTNTPQEVCGLDRSLGEQGNRVNGKRQLAKSKRQFSSSLRWFGQKHFGETRLIRWVDRHYRWWSLSNLWSSGTVYQMDVTNFLRQSKKSFSKKKKKKRKRKKIEGKVVCFSQKKKKKKKEKRKERKEKKRKKERNGRPQLVESYYSCIHENILKKCLVVF